MPERTPKMIYNDALLQQAAYMRRKYKMTTFPGELARALAKAVTDAYDAGRDNPRPFHGDDEITGEYLIPPRVQ